MRHYHVTQKTGEQDPIPVGTCTTPEEARTLLLKTVGTTVANHTRMRVESSAEGSSITVVTAYSSWSGVRVHFTSWPCEVTTCERGER